MNHSDIAALMKGAAPVIRDYVAAAVQPLLLEVETLRSEVGRLKALPALTVSVDMAAKCGEFEEGFRRAGLASDEMHKAIDALRQSVDALPPAPDVDELRKAFFKHVDEKVATLPVPPDVDAVAGVVAERMLPELKELRAAVEALPATPELPDVAGMIADAVAGFEPKVEAFREVVRLEMGEIVAAAVAALPPPQDGKDADPALVASLVTETTERILAGWERPQDGKSVTVEELRPLVDESVLKAVSAIPVPKNGLDAVNLAGALIDRDGNLILTLSDGQTKSLGKVVGTDGADADMAALERRAIELIAALPKPRDGVDGVGFDDMDVLYDGERKFTLRFVKGERTKEVSFRVPVQIYRGVYQEGRTYERGDTVSFGGSTWHCDREDGTTVKPDTTGDAKAWTLSNKRGRDGRDGTLKDPPKPGPVKVG